MAKRRSLLERSGLARQRGSGALALAKLQERSCMKEALREGVLAKNEPVIPYKEIAV